MPQLGIPVLGVVNEAVDSLPSRLAKARLIPPLCSMMWPMKDLLRLVDVNRKQSAKVSSTGGKKAVFFLLVLVAVSVAIEDLLKAYRTHNISDALGVVVAWLVIMPAFLYWWFRQKTS
jgi:hypothetical protein